MQEWNSCSIGILYACVWLNFKISLNNDVRVGYVSTANVYPIMLCFDIGKNNVPVSNNDNMLCSCNLSCLV